LPVLFALALPVLAGCIDDEATTTATTTSTTQDAAIYKVPVSDDNDLTFRIGGPSKEQQIEDELKKDAKKYDSFSEVLVTDGSVQYTVSKAPEFGDKYVRYTFGNGMLQVVTSNDFIIDDGRAYEVRPDMEFPQQMYPTPGVENQWFSWNTGCDSDLNGSYFGDVSGMCKVGNGLHIAFGYFPSSDSGVVKLYSEYGTISGAQFALEKEETEVIPGMGTYTGNFYPEEPLLCHESTNRGFNEYYQMADTLSQVCVGRFGGHSIAIMAVVSSSRVSITIEYGNQAVLILEGNFLDGTGEFQINKVGLDPATTTTTN
jgi:hypothetical protein